MKARTDMKRMQLGVGAAAALALTLALAGCTTVGTLASDSPSNSADKYQDVRQQSALGTVDIESSDLHTACGAFVRKMLADPLLTGHDRSPHFAVDPEFFVDEAAGDFNLNVLVDLLRSELLDAADGRVVLVGREYARFVTKERALGTRNAAQRTALASVLDEEIRDDVAVIGAVGPGTTAPAVKTLGVDYVIGGRVSDVTQEDDANKERYTQIAFEVVDAKTAEIVLCDVHSFKKKSAAPRRWY